METLERIEKEMNQKTKNNEHKEGRIAKFLENQTAKLPSDTYLWAAIGSMAVSFSFKVAKKDSLALFVGQWAPSFLLFGVYNKLVKLQGND